MTVDKPLPAAALVGALLLAAGCRSTPATPEPTPTEPGTVSELTGESESVEASDAAVGVADSTGTDFHALWGPYTDPGVVVNAAVSSPDTSITINATGGDYFLYLTGHFSGISPVSVGPPPAAAVLPIWPIVYSTRVKIGASGTSFLLHVNEASQEYTVIRLRQKNSAGAWAGGEVEVRAESGASVRIPKSLETSQAVVFNGLTGALSGPADLTANQRAIADEVIRRAGLRGLHVPAEAP